MTFPRNMRQARRYFEVIARVESKEPTIDALIQATAGGSNLPGVPGPQGIPGPPGPPGKSLHTGLGDPSEGIGSIADTYVDVATGNVFVKE